LHNQKSPKLTKEKGLWNGNRNLRFGAITGFPISSRHLIRRADCDIETFRSSQRPLDAVGGQKRVALEFQCQRDVQEVESSAAEPLCVFFRKFSSA
jgi:hypothetical protein